jgi:hypothetical protein
LNALAELAIALVELLEAEGRAFRRSLMRTGAGLGLIVTSAILGLTGLGLCLWSAYLYLGTVLEPPQAALAAGGLTLALAAVLLWIALRLNR